MEGPNKVRGLEKNRKINKRGGDVYLAPESTCNVQSVIKYRQYDGNMNDVQITLYLLFIISNVVVIIVKDKQPYICGMINLIQQPCSVNDCIKHNYN